MALKPKQIAEIVKLYDGGAGDDIESLAAAYETNPAAIRFQLKKAGAYRGDDESPSDEDLGIGEDDEPAGNSLADILKNPALQALIDQAVNARIAQMGGTPVQRMAETPTGESTAVVKAIEHLLEVQSQQMPGYIKPMSADEVDRRAQAHIEMLALIRDCQARGDAPHYIVGPSGLFDSTNIIRYEPGQEIKAYLEPVEDFVPLNDAARKIHATLIRSIGGATPEIGAQVAEAMLASKRSDIPTLGGPPQTGNANRVELVSSTTRHDVGPKRVAGTIVPEQHGTSMPVQPGITQQPAGPVFVGA